MKPVCRVVRSIAPSREIGALSTALDKHVSACLSCQAEMARYGRLRRQLASLAHVVDEAPEPLADAVVAAIAAGEVPEDSNAALSHPARVAAAAGAVVAAAAGAAAVAAWRHSRVVVR